MKYSVLKCRGTTGSDILDKGPRLLVVASDRIEALEGVIGPHEEIARVRGVNHIYFIYNDRTLSGFIMKAKT